MAKNSALPILALGAAAFYFFSKKGEAKSDSKSDDLPAPDEEIPGVTIPGQAVTDDTWDDSKFPKITTDADRKKFKEAVQALSDAGFQGTITVTEEIPAFKSIVGHLNQTMEGHPGFQGRYIDLATIKADAKGNIEGIDMYEKAADDLDGMVGAISFSREQPQKQMSILFIFEKDSQQQAAQQQLQGLLDLAQSAASDTTFVFEDMSLEDDVKGESYDFATETVGEPPKTGSLALP